MPTTPADAVTTSNLQQSSFSRQTRSSSRLEAMPTDLDDLLEAPDIDNMPTLSHIGEPAMATYIRHQAHSTGFTLTDSVSSMLGLQNREAGYPLLDLGPSEDRWRELEPILPRPYLPFFREGIRILDPLLPNDDDFDARVCTYLEDFASNRLKDRALDGDDQKARDVFAWIGFLLAALAAGSQCSADKSPQRKVTTQEFIYKAFHCLRMSNFLLRPTLFVVQTYLLIVIVLQNDSEPDAAWALLGTVMRLAQSIGLHLQHFREAGPQSTERARESTWRALLWQDCILSLCYGRPATATEGLPQLSEDRTEFDDGERYRECLWRLSNIALLYMRSRPTALGSYQQLKSCIQRIEDLQHLVKAPKTAHGLTLKDRLEYHSFRICSSFVISFLCQQRLRHIQVEQPRSEEQTEWSEKLVQALSDSITSFLDLHTVSMLPLRIWSWKHIVLSSAFLLSFRSDLKRRSTLFKTVEELVRVLSTTAEDEPENSMGTLTTPHARAVRLLQDICRKNGSHASSRLSTEAGIAAERDGHNMPSAAQRGANEVLQLEPGGDVYGFASSNELENAQFDNFWDDEFFALLTGNSNIPSKDVLDGFPMENWNQF